MTVCRAGELTIATQYYCTPNTGGFTIFHKYCRCSLKQLILRQY